MNERTTTKFIGDKLNELYLLTTNGVDRILTKLDKHGNTIETVVRTIIGLEIIILIYLII